MTQQHTLSASEEKLLDRLGETSPFWGSIRAKYAEYGALTDSQYECFERDAARISWQRSAPKIGGVPVRNKFRAGKSPRCASRAEFCPSAATQVVGQFAYCINHVDAAREEYDEWIAARRQEREQDANAEATGT